MSSPFRFATHARIARQHAARIETLCAALETESDPHELVYIAGQLSSSLLELTNNLRCASDKIGEMLRRVPGRRLVDLGDVITSEPVAAE